MIQSFDDLTEDERRYLAMHARYESSGQLDPRRYATGESQDGAQKLSTDWLTRKERSERWLQIANALHSDPWGTMSEEE